jgi:hypothetical protein
MQMNLIIRFVLELFRILALLMLLEGLAMTSFSAVELEEAASGVSLVVMLLFAIWYRRWGQHSGWYPVQK